MKKFNLILMCIISFFLFQTTFEIIWGYSYKPPDINNAISGIFSVYQRQFTLTGFSMGVNIWFWNTLSLIISFIVCSLGLFYIRLLLRKEDRSLLLFTVLCLLILIIIDVYNLKSSGSVIAIIYSSNSNFFIAWLSVNKFHGLLEMFSYSIPEGYLLSWLISTIKEEREFKKEQLSYKTLTKNIIIIFIIAECFLTIAAFLETYFANWRL